MLQYMLVQEWFTGGRGDYEYEDIVDYMFITIIKQKILNLSDFNNLIINSLLQNKYNA